MWVNLKEEIRQKAKLLRSQGYEFTGKWCEQICKNLHRYAKLPQIFNADVEDLLLTFRQEFTGRTDYGSRKLREEYLKIAQILLEKAIRNSPDSKKMFRELVPFPEQGANTGRTIGEIVKVFSDLDEQFLEARMYASLFVFMLHIEGAYFPAIRTLCALKLAGEGKNIDFEPIQKMSYENIRKELGSFGEPLFRVYDDLGRNLRNAVAHANFRYEKEKLICWNIEPRTKIETWKRDFTYDELSTTLADIYSISHAYLFWYILRELISKIAQHVGLHNVG